MIGGKPHLFGVLTLKYEQESFLMNMKKQIVKYFFMFVAVLSTAYFWFMVFRIVNSTNTENWFLPIIVFSVMFTSWALAILLENNHWHFFIFELILIFSGFIFGQTLFMIGSSFIAMIVLYLGTVWVHESMEARIKLNIWMSLRLGRRLFVTAISIIIIGGFLIPVVLSGREKVLPLINITDNQTRVITKVMSIFDSNLKNNNLTQMTVDEYIAKEEGNRINNNTGGGVSHLLDTKNNAILIAGRKSISKMVSRDVKGDEKMINIFTEIINNKINDYFNTEISQASDFAPLFFSGLSFFAVFSVGSFVTSFLTFLVTIIFKVLLLTKLVKVGTKEVQVEVIE